MTHPTAGPDDRSPLAEELFLAENFERWGAAGRCSRPDAEKLMAYQAAIGSALRSARRDVARVDYLETRLEDDESIRMGYTDEWYEHGEAGSILSSGPREFWLSDDGVECGPTLRDAIDEAMASVPLILEKNDRGTE